MDRSVSIATLCMAGAMLAAVTACTNSPENRRAHASVRIAVAFPVARIPGSGVNPLIERLTTERLLSLDDTGKSGPGLAESWSWDASRTRLRLRLRRGVMFHDGTPLTAQIAAESLQAAWKTSPPPSLSSIDAIAPLDERTLEFRLRQPDAFVLEDLNLDSLRLPKHPEIGNGPFQLVDSTDDRIRVKAFPRYYGGRPALDEMEVDVYRTQRNAWAAMLRDRADVLYEVSRDALEFVQAETRVRTYSFPRPYYVMLAFNVHHPALKSAAVRRAINWAVDRDAVVREGLRGQGQPADGPIWKDHWAYAAPRDPFRYDADRASRELDAAGFPMRRDATRGEMPHRLTFTCLLYGEDARFERMALLLQKQLYEIGVDMRLQPVGLLDMTDRAKRGDFDALLFEMVGGKFLGSAYSFWHSPVERKLIDTGYKAADDVLDRLRRSTSEEAVRRAVADLNEVFSADPPAVFIAWQSQTRAASRRLTIPDEPNTDILASGLNLWKIRSEQQVAAR